MYKPIQVPNELGRNRWNMFSQKLQREVKIYGDLKYDHWVLVETDPSIVNYCERPKQIVQSFEGEVISTTFDMSLKKYTGFEEFVSVNYSFKFDPLHKLYSEKTCKEVHVQRRWCEENRYNFRVLTEVDIRGNQVLLDNCKRLLPFKPIYDLGSLMHGFEILEEITSGTTIIVDIERKFKQNKNVSVLNIIYTMIKSGFLLANVDEVLLGYQTEVKVNGEKAIT